MEEKPTSPGPQPQVPSGIRVDTGHAQTVESSTPNGASAGFGSTEALAGLGGSVKDVTSPSVLRRKGTGVTMPGVAGMFSPGFKLLSTPPSPSLASPQGSFTFDAKASKSAASDNLLSMTGHRDSRMTTRKLSSTSSRVSSAESPTHRRSTSPEILYTSKNANFDLVEDQTGDRFARSPSGGYESVALRSSTRSRRASPEHESMTWGVGVESPAGGSRRRESATGRGSPTGKNASMTVAEWDRQMALRARHTQPAQETAVGRLSSGRSVIHRTPSGSMQPDSLPRKPGGGEGFAGTASFEASLSPSKRRDSSISPRKQRQGSGYLSIPSPTVARAPSGGGGYSWGEQPDERAWREGQQGGEMRQQGQAEEPRADRVPRRQSAVAKKRVMAAMGKKKQMEFDQHASEVIFVSHCKHCKGELLRRQAEGWTIEQMLGSQMRCAFCESQLLKVGRQDLTAEMRIINRMSDKHSRKVHEEIDRLKEIAQQKMQARELKRTSSFLMAKLRHELEMADEGSDRRALEDAYLQALEAKRSEDLAKKKQEDEDRLAQMMNVIQAQNNMLLGGGGGAQEDVQEKEGREDEDAEDDEEDAQEYAKQLQKRGKKAIQNVNDLPLPKHAPKVVRGCSAATMKKIVASSKSLQKLTSDELDELVRYVTIKTYATAHVIIEEGEIGQSMFAIVDGELDVYVKDKWVFRGGRGHVVGEIGLVSKAPRTASVAAAMETVLMEITDDAFSYVLRKRPQVWTNITKLARENTKVRAARRAVKEHAVKASPSPGAKAKKPSHVSPDGGSFKKKSPLTRAVVGIKPRQSTVAHHDEPPVIKLQSPDLHKKKGPPTKLQSPDSSKSGRDANSRMSPTRSTSQDSRQDDDGRLSPLGSQSPKSPILTGDGHAVTGQRPEEAVSAARLQDQGEVHLDVERPDLALAGRDHGNIGLLRVAEEGERGSSGGEVVLSSLVGGDQESPQDGDEDTVTETSGGGFASSARSGSAMAPKHPARTLNVRAGRRMSLVDTERMNIQKLIVKDTSPSSRQEHDLSADIMDEAVQEAQDARTSLEDVDDGVWSDDAPSDGEAEFQREGRATEARVNQKEERDGEGEKTVEGRSEEGGGARVLSAREIYRERIISGSPPGDRLRFEGRGRILGGSPKGDRQGPIRPHRSAGFAEQKDRHPDHYRPVRLADGSELFDEPQITSSWLLEQQEESRKAQSQQKQQHHQPPRTKGNQSRPVTSPTMSPWGGSPREAVAPAGGADKKKLPQLRERSREQVSRESSRELSMELSRELSRELSKEVVSGIPEPGVVRAPLGGPSSRPRPSTSLGLDRGPQRVPSAGSDSGGAPPPPVPVFMRVNSAKSIVKDDKTEVLESEYAWKDMWENSNAIAHMAFTVVVDPRRVTSRPLHKRNVRLPREDVAQRSVGGKVFWRQKSGGVVLTSMQRQLQEAERVQTPMKLTSSVAKLPMSANVPAGKP